ncbi:MAG: hypothetical protein ACI389_06165 [Methanobrevibacter sp.]|uniref:hypothetical protein n=1 Tax=Methanobrevibacter sp. TaxID=66852 RepID=UPI003F0CF5D3
MLNCFFAFESKGMAIADDSVFNTFMFVAELFAEMKARSVLMLMGAGINFVYVFVL